MDLQDLFRRSFAIWWRVRSLWAAGMLAALFGYGEYGASASVQSRNTTFAPIRPGGPSPLDQLRANPQIAWLLDNLAMIVVALVAVIIVWSVVAGLVGALANGAMIALADSAAHDLPTGLGDGMRAGAARALPLFLIGLLLALPSLLILAVIFAVAGRLLWQILSGGTQDPAAILPALFGTLACIVLLLLPSLLLGLALGLIGRLAARACVVEGLGSIASIGRGMGLIRRNLGRTLLLWLVMGIMGLVLSALMGLPAIALLLPITAGLSSGGLSGLPTLALIGLGLYGLVVNVGLGGILTSFNATIWTLFYRGILAREGIAAAPIL